MTIRPIDLNGVIQRTDDVGYLKQLQDSKPLQDQQNIQMTVDQREDDLAHLVIDPDDISTLDNETDAKDGSRNQYMASSANKRKKKKETAKVVKKNSTGSFDIKI